MSNILDAIAIFRTTVTGQVQGIRADLALERDRRVADYDGLAARLAAAEELSTLLGNQITSLQRDLAAERGRVDALNQQLAEALNG